MIRSFRVALKRWTANRRGNIAVAFALLLPVLVLASTATVDVAGLMSTKVRAQDALDAANLAAASSSYTADTDLQTVASNALTANIQGTSAQGTSISALHYDSTAQTITTTASGSYTPVFGFLLAGQPLTYTVRSTVGRTVTGTLEVALVLDNTWSMSQTLGTGQTKIAALKQAALAMVTQVMTAQNQGKVKMGIVPYGDYINVGTNNRSQTWLNVAADYSVTSTQTCTTKTTKTVCSGGTKTTCSSTKDGVTTTSSCTTGQTCSTVTVAPYQSCSGGGTTNYKWYGCVRNKVNSSTNTLAMPDTSGQYVGIVATSQNCLTAITPLTTDSSVVNAGINALVVNVGGYYPETYIPGGLVWGVNVLSSAAPFTEGAPYDPANVNPRKVIVLMTDGANTDKLNTDGSVSVSSGTPTATYTAQAAVCANAKQNNIEIYTIGVGVTDTTALSNLQACATDASHYYNAQSTTDMIAAFAKIGASLRQIRIVT